MITRPRIPMSVTSARSGSLKQARWVCTSASIWVRFIFYCATFEALFRLRSLMNAFPSRHFFSDKDDPRLLKYKSEWTCEVCQKKFRLRCSLQAHKKSHLGERIQALPDPISRLSLKIGLCYKNFGYFVVNFHVCFLLSETSTYTQMINRYPSISGKENPEEAVRKLSYKCKFCDRGFALKTSMQRHERLHTGKTSIFFDTIGMS